MSHHRLFIYILTFSLFFFIAGCGPQESEQPDGVVRTFYIAADEVEWDYVPSGKNAMDGLPLSEQVPIWAPGTALSSRQQV
ncbi:MAG: hypothetical protein IID52_03875 [Proteobacteria bacterium]|nr:hypothetical protein [Pseudomonadota bacterium]